jgi:two-component system CheB/CheR fusion protein
MSSRIRPSPLDLISCRNLLIYMGAGLQKKLMPLFHYALNPGGYLFLGTSESVGDFTHLFTTVDRRSKLYRRRDDTPRTRGGSMGWRAPPATAREDTPPPPARRVIPPGRPPLRELTERALLQHVAASAALVDGRGDILYLHGRTGTYLEPVAGEAGVNNILKMAREGLMREMVTALHSAVATKTVVRVPGLRVRTNGATATVNLTIHPIPPSAAGASEAALYLVVLEEPPPSSADPSAPATPRDALGAEAPDTDDDPRIIALKHELRAKEDYLRAANEELQTSNEELKSSNEEMQSVNEELQSANEELETSREELQSVNEELATVNAELQAKVGDLSRVNNDMNNLLAGTGIGTIFVDHQLRILRFTPAATRIVNLIPGDVGRSVGHVVTNFIGYDRLLNDATEVLNTLVPREAQVQTTDGKWYTVSILPYRTLENVIEGAVITFVDITDMKRAEAALRDQQAAVK